MSHELRMRCWGDDSVTAAGVATHYNVFDTSFATILKPLILTQYEHLLHKNRKILVPISQRVPKSILVDFGITGNRR